MSNAQNERRPDDEPANDGETDRRDKSLNDGGVPRSAEDLDEKLKFKATANQKSGSPGERSPRDEGQRKHPGWKRGSKGNDDDDSRGPNSDICRICHMGGFPSSGANRRASRDRRGEGVRRVDSQISTPPSCAHLGPLISACKCRGTVALVHAECIERWLTESGHTRCELCGYKYATKRVPRHNTLRSVIIWFNTVIATRQMLLDVLYLLVTTPLAAFSCYICALAVRLLVKNGVNEVPWMIIAILPTCSLTLIAYWGWLVTLGRLHGRQWRRYWRSNFVIRLVEDTHIEVNDRSAIRQGEREETEDQDRNEEIEEFLQVL